MGWVKRATLSLVLLNSVTSAIALTAEPATPAPGDVVVEIKIEPSHGRSLPAIPAGTSTPAIPGAPYRYPSLNSQQLDRQLQLYTQYLARFGQPDILIVGSSRALQGVDPIALQHALAKRGYPNLKIFNFGINGATAQVVDWLLRQLLTPEQLPRLIVWADGARAFNSGRIDHTFNKIRASQGYQALSAGIRPFTSQIGGIEVGQLCMDGLPLKFPSQLKSTSPNLRQLPLNAKKEALCDRTAKVTIRSGVLSPSLAMQPSSYETLGFQLVNTQFNPDRYFRQFPRVSGYYDADYRQFTLAGRQIKALEQVVTFANKKRIPLVFFNLPLTQTYLDSARWSYEAQFRREMQRFERSRQFEFRDLVLQPGLDSNRYFADPSHLNRHGAAVVSVKMSADLTRYLARIMPPATRLDGARSRPSPIVQCEKGCLYLPKILASFQAIRFNQAVYLD